MLKLFLKNLLFGSTLLSQGEIHRTLPYTSKFFYNQQLLPSLQTQLHSKVLKFSGFKGSLGR